MRKANSEDFECQCLCICVALSVRAHTSTYTYIYIYTMKVRERGGSVVRESVGLKSGNQWDFPMQEIELERDLQEHVCLI